MWMLLFADASFSMTCRVIPNASEESSAMWMLLFADASFSMTCRVIPSVSEESSAMWMLHFADASFSMTCRVIPSVSEESSAWMLHFVQHDSSVKTVRSWSYRISPAAPRRALSALKSNSKSTPK